jgi:hypothetical protein
MQRLNVANKVLREYCNPFAGFSDDEMAIEDGIILEPVPAE